MMTSCLLLTLIISTSTAQISLEFTYPNGGQKLSMVNLEEAGPTYIEVYRQYYNYRYISFYHANHSFWFNIDVNPLPRFSPCGGVDSFFYFTPLYISQHLFDDDDGIEFIYTISSECNWFTGIYNDDGTPILEVDSASALVPVNVPQAWRPIYNTPYGTKLILYMQNGSARVYSLPGTLESGIDEMQTQGTDDYLRAYPNPSFYQTTIDFTLPEEINQAMIVITDLNGHELQQYAVDKTFGNLYINQSDVAPGTYIYSLMHDGEVLDSQKIVLAK